MEVCFEYFFRSFIEKEKKFSSILQNKQKLFHLFLEILKLKLIFKKVFFFFKKYSVKNGILDLSIKIPFFKFFIFTRMKKNNFYATLKEKKFFKIYLYFLSLEKKKRLEKKKNAFQYCQKHFLFKIPLVKQMKNKSFFLKAYEKKKKFQSFLFFKKIFSNLETLKINETNFLFCIRSLRFLSSKKFVGI